MKLEPDFLPFGQRVIVQTQNSKAQHLNGQGGTIDGQEVAFDGRAYYSVFIASENCAWCFYEDEIIVTTDVVDNAQTLPETPKA